MPKVHELLAVEKGLSETANRVTKETTKTLDTKRSIFEGMSKEHEIFADDQQHLKQATELKEVQSTVDEQLDYMCNEVGRYWDVILQKEDANQKGKADIIVDGLTIAKNIPTLVLLGLETRLESLISTYNAIPTLDAAKAWQLDENYGKAGVWRTTNPIERQQSVTVKDWVEVSPATREHKAQIVQDEKINVIGKYTVTDFSGSLTSLDKAERLQRLGTLTRAVKAARQRANDTEVDTNLLFGESLFGYINGK